jgi:hypothetical protein
LCYFVYLGTALTLSEVRSMLPSGMTAHVAEPAEQQRLLALLPEAKTVVRLLVGACSCDLVRHRHSESREDERHHRERYRRLGGERPAMIAALERHRRGAGIRPPRGGWPKALADLVAEHARNAGPSLYLLRFLPEPTPASPPAPVRHLSLALVLAAPDRWLEEGVPILVSR